MKKLALVTAAVASACLAFAGIASAADPIRTDKISGRYFGKTWKGTVKYPWPAQWTIRSYSVYDGNPQEVDLGGGCAMNLWLDNFMTSRLDGDRTWFSRDILRTGSFVLNIGDATEATPLGFARKGQNVWWAYEGSATENDYGEVAYPNSWFISGRADVRVAKNRQLNHRIRATFTGTCTTAQRTTSTPVKALVAAIRNAVVSIKIS